LLLPNLVPHHETESVERRWEFVVTAAVFAFIALIGPMVIGTQMTRRDRDLHRAMIRLSQKDELTSLFNRRRTTELIDNEIRRNWP
jgi:hypothetical protein